MVRHSTLCKLKVRLATLLAEESVTWWDDLPPAVAERRRNLHEILVAVGVSSVKQIAEMLSCSVRTVHRDFRWLKDYTARFDDGRERHRLGIQTDSDYKKIIADKILEANSEEIGSGRRASLMMTAMAMEQKRIDFLFDVGLIEPAESTKANFKVMSLDQLRRQDAKLGWRQAKLECKLEEFD